MNQSCGRHLCVSFGFPTLFVFVFNGVVVLHPKYRKKWFNKAKWRDDWVDTLVRSARDVWQKTYSKLAKARPKPTTSVKSSSAFSSLDAPVTQTAADPFEDFINGSPTDDDPLAYWTARLAPQDAESITPTQALASMALDFHSAPATSTDVERLFSDGGLVVSKRRYHLTAEHICQSVVLGNWIAVGVVPGRKIATMLKKKKGKKCCWNRDRSGLIVNVTLMNQWK